MLNKLVEHIKMKATPAAAPAQPLGAVSRLTKVGFVHIPKSAGQSLSESLFKAFELDVVHLTEVVPFESTTPPRNPLRTIVRGTPGFIAARNLPLLSGHATFTDMRALGREFIFTVLRDPKKRLISLYTYTLKRSTSEKVLKNHPSLRDFAGMSFLDFMEGRPMSNRMASQLLGDLPGYNAFREEVASGAATSKELVRFMDKGLKRFGAVYACSNQEILDDLHRRGLIPPAVEVRMNSSEGTVLPPLPELQRFLALVEKSCRFDVLVYQRAMELFPETVHTPLSTNDEFVAELRKRFQARFADDPA